MKFKSSFEQEMEMEMKTDSSFEADDDLFYAELRRQILLLTAEDNDNEDAEFRESKHSKPGRGTKQGSGTGCPAVLLPGSYFGWSENIEDRNAVPTWLANLWRHGTGTGVFIPHTAKSRRRQKRGRRNNARGRTYNPAAKTE